jgi:hypothetical protein
MGPPVPGGWRNQYLPAGPSQETLTTQKEDRLRSSDVSKMPRMKGNAFRDAFLPKPSQQPHEVNTVLFRDEETEAQRS